ncbi:hypothetical protein CWI42_070320 [Ordospora colligata]|uniref:Gamma-soluble NSF attachment protein n=1 Tax=Ordospora colligata OC4 TaxID=1354746 RepID=A0A0B2UKC7_9MICR|nr:uncharacterized protein M896_070320 [Ordospora colligata OC4]KHN69465.1 hypothetical protein M896_070320 [Ordospora colligata OC4]TBU15280.1 hypothetical protein CWI40_070320 [Ordospora colligata]TBU18462.1 hypothetical protein CWI42_070320 [Ordospora colligata]
MDVELKERKVKEAERLRKKRSFPFSLFYHPDYYASAEIFMQLGNSEDDVEKKVEYYEEAAKTHEMDDGEYSKYLASQVYEKIGETCEQTNKRKAVDAYTKSGEYSKRYGRDSLAAICFQRISSLLKSENEIEAAYTYLTKVVECYSGSGWKHHRIKAMKDVAETCIELKRYGEASKIYIKLNGNMDLFCAFLCQMIEGVPTDLQVSGDEEKLCKAIEEGGDKAMNAINEYMLTHAMSREVKMLLEIILSRLQPENDIL